MKRHFAILLTFTAAVACPKQEPEKVSAQSVPRMIRVQIPIAEDLMTPEVLEHAAKQFKTEDADGQAACEDLKGATRALRYAARSVISRDPKIFQRMYGALMGPQHATEDMAYQPELVMWDDAMREVAREHLRDPERLRTTFMALKLFITGRISLLPPESRAKCRTYITEKLIPVFTKPNPDIVDLIRLKQALQGDYKGASERTTAAERFCPWTSASWNSETDLMDYVIRDDAPHCKDAALYALKRSEAKERRTFDGLSQVYSKVSSTPLHREYEWMLRRYAEGGMPLVSAYAEIFGEVAKML